MGRGSDAEDPWGIVARLMVAMPAGSYLAISHPAIDIGRHQADAQRTYNERISTSQTLRTRDQVARSLPAWNWSSRDWYRSTSGGRIPVISPPRESNPRTVRWDASLTPSVLAV